MPSPRTLITRPSLVIGVLDPVIVAVWTGLAPRAEDVSVCMVPMLAQARSFGQCALVVAIHTSTPLPDARARDAITTEMRKLDPHLLCGATVIARGGLAGTALRAVTSTLQLLSRTTHPERIVSTGAEAAKFLAGVLGRRLRDPPSENTISAAYDEMTQRVWSATQAG